MLIASNSNESCKAQEITKDLLMAREYQLLKRHHFRTPKQTARLHELDALLTINSYELCMEEVS